MKLVATKEAYQFEPKYQNLADVSLQDYDDILRKASNGTQMKKKDRSLSIQLADDDDSSSELGDAKSGASPFNDQCDTIKLKSLVEAGKRASNSGSEISLSSDGSTLGE